MVDELRFDPEPAGGDGGPASELRATPRRRAAAGEPQRVIVKVRTPNYVPEGFEVRTRVDDVLFTADASHEALEAAGADPDVESVSTPRRLRPSD